MMLGDDSRLFIQDNFKTELLKLNLGYIDSHVCTTYLVYVTPLSPFDRICAGM